MSAEHRADIRDRRKAGWFRVDDELVEDFGPEIGAHGIAVYAVICKHADNNEESYPGLRRFCEKLKIGRATLLKTLAKLEEVGLISIEPGDRKTVSVYTLLDVPKGGSRQNQGVVPDRTRGGSKEDQGGGSDQNHNQTHREPNPINQREENAPPPDDTTSQCLLLLKKVNGIGKDYGQLAILVAELREEFPKANPEEVCRDYEFNHRVGKEKTKIHAAKLRSYFRTANTPKRSNGSRAPVEPEDPTEARKQREAERARQMREVFGRG